MGLTTWKSAPGGKIVKSDVSVAKNYLIEREVKELERIFSIYLDYAENQAARQIPMRMVDWVAKLDAFLKFNEYEVLRSVMIRNVQFPGIVRSTFWGKYPSRTRNINDRFSDGTNRSLWNPSSRNPRAVPQPSVYHCHWDACRHQPDPPASKRDRRSSGPSRRLPTDMAPTAAAAI